MPPGPVRNGNGCGLLRGTSGPALLFDDRCGRRDEYELHFVPSLIGEGLDAATAVPAGPVRVGAPPR